MVEKVWLFSSSIQVSQYILGLNSRTYELLVPLRSVQQPIMPGAYLIRPKQLLCVPKVKLPRLPLSGELFFKAPGEASVYFICQKQVKWLLLGPRLVFRCV